eukprot:4934068-Prymnesium_polylepis.2
MRVAAAPRARDSQYADSRTAGALCARVRHIHSPTHALRAAHSSTSSVKAFGSRSDIGGKKSSATGCTVSDAGAIRCEKTCVDSLRRVGLPSATCASKKARSCSRVTARILAALLHGRWKSYRRMEHSCHSRPA